MSLDENRALVAELPAGQLAVRAAIDELEQAILRTIADGTAVQTLWNGGTPEGDAQCDHYFGDRVYVRSLWIPAGTCLVGRLHTQARVCMVLAGSCVWVDEDRREAVEAPWIGEFRAGSKTAVFAETDTLWAAALGTDMTDPRTIFSSLTCGSHVEYRQFLDNLTRRGERP
jgi:hypothetical protein